MMELSNEDWLQGALQTYIREPLGRLQGLAGKMDEITTILSKYKTIAVVGLSRDTGKDSYRVAEYLQSKGYRIIPINPFAEEILGEKVYKSLSDMPEDLQRRVEIVDIFRRAEDVPSIVEEAIEVRRRYGNPQVIWMQLGIVNKEAAEKAERAGLLVVIDKCMMIERRSRDEMLKSP